MKKLFLVAMAVIGFAAIANASSEHTATSCHYTGYSSDHCRYIEGSTAYTVLNCTSGSTDCYFDH
jgi:hypothetical protein